MAEQKTYSNRCCGGERSIDLEKDLMEQSFCQSPDPDNVDELLHVANIIKDRFQEKKLKRGKAKKARNVSGTTLTEPYVSYDESEIIYIPTWFHFIDWELHHSYDYEEAGKRAQAVVDGINSHLIGEQEANKPPRLDVSHGVECKLRLKLVNKVPSSWLNPLFQENRNIGHLSHNYNWNRQTQSYDLIGSSDEQDLYINTDPYRPILNPDLDPTTFYNEMHRDSNFDNYYSIMFQNLPHSRDEYFECGEYGCVYK